MTWYKTGTVTVTNGSATVAGVGTAFNGNAFSGEAFQLEGGVTYEITGVVSDTEITIDPPYLGSTQAGQSYRILPVRGFGKLALDAMTTAMNDWNTYKDGALAGLFGDGAAGDSGLGFKDAPGTGFWRDDGGNLIGQRNGSAILKLLAGGANVTGLLTGTAVQQNKTDATLGRVLLNGGFGLGETGLVPLSTDTNDVDQGTGFYRYGPETAGTKPPSGSRGTYLHTTEDGPTGNATQVFLEREVTGARGLYIRICHQGTWSDLTRMDGTYGSGPNGSYVRLADGTQICWLNNFATVSGGAATWTFQAAFFVGLTSPVVIATSRFTTAPRIIAAKMDGAGSISCAVHSWDETGANTVAPPVDLFAIGRWK